MQDGAYAVFTENSMAFIIIVQGGLARCYSVAWHGDLADMEAYRYRISSSADGVDVSWCSTPLEMVNAVTNIQWTPAMIRYAEWNYGFPEDYHLGSDSPLVQLAEWLRKR